jgi:iron complex outermembrane recepter protein
MTRSRLRKLKRISQRTYLAGSVPLAAAMVASLSPAMAQERDDGVLENVIVTAQKRTENLQDVPVSIQAIGTEQLEDLHIKGFEDYVRYLPTVSYQTFGPGFAQVYMRGVASGGDGNHSGSLPSVGVYLDEQPITTIQGALDVHLYDIARVEALAGPQGTLYGASSQAGTLRIISNKPDASQFAAGYDLEGSTMTDGSGGYLAQGYANIPLTANSAVRLVGWKRHDPGFIDNVFRERSFADSGITGVAPVNNAGREKEDYNDADTTGARAALKLDLNDNWTITPQLMAQEQKSRGTFGFDPSVGDLKVAHKYPEKSKDRWYQAALTVEGKIANLDLTYAGGYLNRKVDTESDYSDYSYWYDAAYYANGGLFGTYFYDDAGDYIDLSQYIQGKDRYTRWTHELRVATPAENRLRFVGGLFTQRQAHDIQQRYLINDLSAVLEVTGWPDTLWLTEQERIDRDNAVFGELSYDITDQLTVTGGLRYFEAENSLEGFFGFSDDFSGSGRNGETLCSRIAGDPRRDTSSWEPFTNIGTAPCKNLDRRVDEKDSIHKLNVSYHLDDARMVYATWSRGFRPGGINRVGTVPPYSSDFLTNYEIGWKTTWAGNRLRFNGALFSQEWEDFQFSFLGPNGLTIIQNANQARINGLELDATWAAGGGLVISGGVAFLDSELTEDYCGFTDPDTSKPITSCPAGVQDPRFDDPFEGPQAPKGTELPVAPNFKGNMTARYEFPVGSFDAHVQGALVYAGKRWADVRVVERGIVGELDSYSIFDFTAGVDNGTYSLELFVGNAFDKRGEVTRFAQCAEQMCGFQTYIVTTPPRTMGLRFGQKF